MALPGGDDRRHVIERAIAERIFPAAVVDVGSTARRLWGDAFGTLTFDGDSEAVADRTPFDLASLTKVIATTSVVMELVGTGAVGFDEPAAAFFGEWRGSDRERVTVRDLLEHASGLPARLVDPPPHGRREFEHEICTMPLEYAPRSRSVYSDLGFILLGFLAADRGGAPLSVQIEALLARLTPMPDLLTFTPSPEERRRAAPTLAMGDDVRRGRMLVGEVHDNYAAALGGVAGHAGMFGTAADVGRFARTVLRAARGGEGPEPFSAARTKQVTTKSMVEGSSRALGWDTMLRSSSCGTRMSAAAFGHVGFTGTSLWIDPIRDRYFVLLTNRACGGGSLEQMRNVRRAFHDALADIGDA
jgi:CubicO group peptidase (beta-lactamase class C family)